MSPTPLDGNVTAGDLADIFAFDATTAITTCATCRHTHAVATLRAYVRAPWHGAALHLLRRRPNPHRACPAASMARASRHRHARDPAVRRGLTGPAERHSLASAWPSC